MKNEAANQTDPMNAITDSGYSWYQNEIYRLCQIDDEKVRNKAKQQVHTLNDAGTPASYWNPKTEPSTMKNETAATNQAPIWGTFTHAEFNIIVNNSGEIGYCWGQQQFPANYPEKKYAGRTIYAVSIHDAGETEHYLDGEITRISRKQFNQILETL